MVPSGPRSEMGPRGGCHPSGPPAPRPRAWALPQGRHLSVCFTVRVQGQRVNCAIPSGGSASPASTSPLSFKAPAVCSGSSRRQPWATGVTIPTVPTSGEMALAKRPEKKAWDPERTQAWALWCSSGLGTQVCPCWTVSSVLPDPRARGHRSEPRVCPQHVQVRWKGWAWLWSWSSLGGAEPGAL